MKLKDLLFYFQPIFGIARKPLIHEALVRWAGPDGSIRSPALFLDALLESDLAGAFTELTIERAASVLSRYPAVGSISINLSPAQLCRPATLSQIASLPMYLRRRLVLEITEQDISDREAYRLCTGEAANLGVSLVLDDVVPEEIDRRLLPQLAIGGVKLDREVLPRLLGDQPDPEVRAMIRELRRLKLSITVEGIDNPTRIPVLMRLGADRFQGYGLGMPAPTLWSGQAGSSRAAAEAGQPTRLQPI